MAALINLRQRSSFLSIHHYKSQLSADGVRVKTSVVLAHVTNRAHTVLLVSNIVKLQGQASWQTTYYSAVHQRPAYLVNVVNIKLASLSS
jgi:hypothetical protein